MGFVVISLFSALCLACARAEYTVTVYPEYLSQNGRSHFEADRWDGHNNLDDKHLIAPNKAIGSEAGRWMNRDLNSDVYKHTPQDPHRHGYPDPNHFNNHNFQQSLVGKFMDNVNGYGRDLDVVMMLHAKNVWPSWMDTSKYKGTMPNNLDAAAEFNSLLLGAISKGTGGILPPYFEVINEPDTMYKTVDWKSVIEVHKLTAAKLKAKFPKMKVGGPTMTGYLATADRWGYKEWHTARDFLDMSLSHMDFFSFHPYNNLKSYGGSHHFQGINEARLVAVIDMIESYAHKKRGSSVQLVLSEYGLGGRDYDSQTKGSLIDWAYAYQHNAFMFTFLNFRDVVDRAVAFLLSHVKSNFAHSSLFDNNNHETIVGKSYRFWKNFNYNQQFLRVDSQFDGAERMISPLAVAEPNTKKVTILLNNYKQSAEHVKFNFHNNWITPADAHSTCLYMDSSHTPHYTENQAVHLSNHGVNLPSEATCFFTFQTGHNFGGTPTVTEQTHYSRDMEISIHNNAIQTSVNLPSSGTFHSAYLRFSVSTSNKGDHTVPRSVSVNGHSVTRHFVMYDADRSSAPTLWDTIVYQIPTSSLRHGVNNVHLQFAQSGGSVSTLGLVVGSLSDTGHIVG